MIIERSVISRYTVNKILLELQREDKIHNIRGYRENYFNTRA